MVKLLYFMKLADIIGFSQEQLSLPQEVTNVAELLAHLRQRGEQYQTALADTARLQVTIKKKFVEPDSAVRDADEIAFFPKAR